MRNRIEYASIRYAGRSTQCEYYRGGIVACSASPTLINITISDSSNSGLCASNSSLLLQDSTIQNNANYGIALVDSNPQMQNNTIQNNQNGGVQLQSKTTALGALPWTGNQILNNVGNAISVIYGGGGGLPTLGTGNTISGNSGVNGLGISGSMGMATTWPASYPLPLVIGGLTINNGTELTVSPGAQLLSNSGYLQVNGSLRAIGTTSQRITFTTANPTPQPGQWFGIYFAPDSDDSRNRMEYASIRYAGEPYGCSGAVAVINASPTLINITISESSTSGLCASNSSLLLQDSTIQNNAQYGVYLTNSNAQLLHNTIQNNTQYGIYLLDSNPQLQNNTIQNNQSGGVSIRSSQIALGVLPWTDNQILNNVGYAISVIYSGGGGLPTLGTGNTISGNSGVNGLGISGSMGMATTWPASYPLPLVIGGLIVYNGTELTVSPGAQFLFRNGGFLEIQGALRAIGTAAQPIAFTSANAAPQPGQWSGIYFTPDSDDSRNRMEYASIRYAGEPRGCYGVVGAINASPTLINITISDSSNSGLCASNSSLLLQDSTIQNNAPYGIYLTNSNAQLLHNTIQNNAQYGIALVDSTPQLQNNTIQNNQSGGVSIRSSQIALGALPWTDNQILNNVGYAISVSYSDGGGLPTLGTGNTISGNTGLNGLYISGSMGMATTWPASYPLPLVIGGLIVYNGTELTVSPGAQFLFRNGGFLEIQGALRAIGTAAQPIAFTSANAAPQPGQWSGIYFTPDSDDSRNRMEYASIRYAGEPRGCYGVVGAINASPTLINITISDSSNSGLCATNSSLLLQDSTIQNNAPYGIYLTNSNAQLLHNTIQNNAQYGIALVDSTPQLQNNTIQNNLKGGLSANNSPFSMQNTLIHANLGNGVTIQTSSSASLNLQWSGNIFNSNTGNAVYLNYTNGGGLPVLGTGNSASNNGGFNGLALAGSMGISTILPTNYPFPLGVAGLTVKNGTVLTIDPGVQLSFTSGAYLDISGSLRAIGTATQPIIFTSASSNSSAWSVDRDLFLPRQQRHRQPVGSRDRRVWGRSTLLGSLPQPECVCRNRHLRIQPHHPEQRNPQEPGPGTGYLLGHPGYRHPDHGNQSRGCLAGPKLDGYYPPSFHHSKQPWAGSCCNSKPDLDEPFHPVE